MEKKSKRRFRVIAPQWTPEMQRIWDRAMLIARTRGAYGCTFPVPGTTFRPPTEGTMLYDLCFAASATEEEYQAHLNEVREDMLAWKERVRNARPPSRNLGIDVSKLKITL
jgi:hypothetical protein